MLSIYQITLLLVDLVCPIFLLLDPLLVINYWEKNQCEEEGEEAPMSIFQLAADYYCGDLCFITIICNWGVVFVVYFLFIL